MIVEGIPVARVLGIEVRISLAWVALLAIVLVVGAEQAGAVAPALDPATRWIVGAVVAVAFLVSVLAHELAHAVTARHRGVEPGPIVLGFVGGLAPLEIQAARPRDETAIALAGPVLSLVLALGALAASAVLTGGGLAGALGSGLLVIGGLNLALACLSMLPGIPLDGGRVVRAVAWARSGDRDRASAVAAIVGRTTGWTLAGVGIVAALTVRPIEGLMVLSLGWFLSTGARTLERRLAMARLLRGVAVGAVMERDVPKLTATLTLDTFADRFAGPEAVTSLPVIDEEAPLGVVGAGRLRRIARRAWATTRAAEVMSTPPGAPFLAPDDLLWEALETLQRSGLDGLAVVEDGRFAGMLTRRAVAEAIRSRIGVEAGA